MSANRSMRQRILPAAARARARTSLQLLAHQPAFNPLAMAAARMLPGRQSSYLKKAVFPVGWVDVADPLNGGAFRVRAGIGDQIARELYWHGVGDYEPETLPVAVALARDSEVILDVGAHVGVYTIITARANPEAQVFAFEPMAAIFERLVANVTVNRLSRVVCVAAAAGDFVGQLPLFSPAADAYETVSSSVPRHRLAHRKSPFRCDLTPSLTLDRFVELAEIDRVDLVKIDVEQAELQVLVGMERLIAAHRPHIVCEVFPAEWTGKAQAAATDSIVRAHGYNIYLLTPEGPILRERVQGNRVYWNQLFTMLEPAELRRKLDALPLPRGYVPRNGSHRTK